MSTAACCYLARRLGERLSAEFDHCTLATLCRTLTAEQAIFNSGSMSWRGLKRGRGNDTSAAARALDVEVHAEARALHYLQNRTPVINNQPVDSVAVERAQRSLRAERAGTSPRGWCRVCVPGEGSAECLRALHGLWAQKGEQGSKWAAMGELLIGAKCKVRCFVTLAIASSNLEQNRPERLRKARSR